VKLPLMALHSPKLLGGTDT